MTISAQVIDTIVSGLMTTCISRCVLISSPCRVFEMASATAVFLQYKGESLGRYIRERKLLLAARDLRDTDQRVYDICLKYGFDSQQTFTRLHPDLPICRRALP